MSDMKILLVQDGGIEADITEAVKVLYDLAISSMDFSSGFWTAEDAAPVAKLAELCQFEGHEKVAAYVSKQLHSEEQQAFVRKHKLIQYGTYRIPHDHVFSSQGKCLWPRCTKEGFESNA